MDYQRIINLLDNTPNEPSKFRTKKWIEINDNSCGTFNFNNQNTSIQKSSLCDYSDTYILVSCAITFTGGPDNATEPNKIVGERNKRVMFKNCTPFIDYASKISYIQIDLVKDLDVVMPMYNII